MRPFKILLLLVALLAPGSSGKCQSPDSGLHFWPSGLGFHPLVANHEEPRVGAHAVIGETRLIVAIGNSLDILESKPSGDALRFGLDFFAYARAQSFAQGQLNIDAADGFFGLHLTYSLNPQWQFRLRGLHYSAHLVDGHYDTDHNIWLGATPFPFSRNFFELTCAHQLALVSQFSRIYGGPGVAVFNKPQGIRYFQAHAGVELVSESSPHFYSAYHASLLGIPTYNISNSVEAGVKFGKWNGMGVRLYLSYVNGLGWFGQYYYERKETWGIGVMVDFW
jgi:hypothetical protein